MSTIIDGEGGSPATIDVSLVSTISLSASLLITST
jgi:hypothetical protein